MGFGDDVGAVDRVFLNVCWTPSVYVCFGSGEEGRVGDTRRLKAGVAMPRQRCQ